MIKYPPIAPLILPGDLKYMAACLGTGQINDGPMVRKLEYELAEFHGGDCVCVSSGTSALEIILRFVGWASYTIPYCSHISTVAAARAAGALRFECASEPYIAADLNGRLAHAGAVADACQTPFTPGLLKNRKAVALSFGALKSITGGTGGAILSENPKLIQFAREYKTYGRAIGGDDSDIVRFGSNHKMTDINAALALAQWERREEIIADRWRIHYAYAKLLGDRIPHRHNSEVPWLVDCNVSAEFAASGTFRACLRQYGHYDCLRDYITNWQQAQAPITAVYLPSHFNLPQTEIEKYAEIIMEAHK